MIQPDGGEGTEGNFSFAQPRSTICDLAAKRLPLVSSALFGMLVLNLAVRFFQFWKGEIHAALFPFELDYGEGIVWQQAMLMTTERLYGDILRYPFVVFHYPPVYHLAVRAVSALGPNMLLAGRGVSLTATAATGTLSGAVAFAAARGSCGKTGSVVGGMVAGLCFFTFWPVTAWSPLMRVDMLAIAFSILGIWLATLSRTRPWTLHVAAVAFALAVFTKQTCIAAPVATMAVMVTASPRLAAKSCAVGATTAVAAIAALTVASHGGFLRHVVSYNINRFSFDAAVEMVWKERMHFAYVLAGLAAYATMWRRYGRPASTGGLDELRRALSANDSMRACAILAVYVAIATVMLIFTGKSGANLNYFIEWMAGLSALVGFAAAAGFEAGRRRGGSPSLSALTLAVALPLLLLLRLPSLPVEADRGVSEDPADLAKVRGLVERISKADKPVLSDDMTLLMLAGKPVPWEPAIFAELASHGAWDENLIVDMIRRRKFAFVVTQGGPGDRLYDARFNPAVHRAIVESYPIVKRILGYAVRTTPTATGR